MIVIAGIKIEPSDGGYWLYENEGPNEGEGMEITGETAKKFEILVRDFYDRNF